MRNIMLCLSLTINLVFLIVACTKSETNTASSNGSTPKNELTMRNATNPANAVEAICPGPEPRMSKSQVAQMVTNYKNNQWVAINNALGFTDARSACFDLDTLENYICHLKSLIAAANCPSLNDPGVRFYFAAYGQSVPPGMPSSNARKTTLVMIPAYKNAQGAYIDFDPNEINPLNCIPFPLNRAGMQKLDNGGIQAGNGNANTNCFAADHPTLAPPPNTGLAF